MWPDVIAHSTGTWRNRRISTYVDYALQHDLSVVGQVQNPRLLRRCLQALAANTAGIPERKTLYNAAQISRVTGNAYDSLLEAIFLVEYLPAWASNRLDRLVKTPKRYLTDPALLQPLAGVDVRSVKRNADMVGRVVDSFVVAQLRPELEISHIQVDAFHLRSQQGRHEVDLLLQARNGLVVGCEVKAAAAVDSGDAKHLMWLRDKLGEEFVCGVVFHTGQRKFRLGDRIFALPIASIWGVHASGEPMPHS